ncbi:uncharacterized protein LOC124666285 isoform X3 [Lolium rigidum]|uniref:uncharacterized protein LOC124666285 isoform X3 n=1 Tax=Lolium rigidum TaxID=89674 RepID=UPI001F5C4E21|nr:uncharacterized protein LOC124666285 isoform X3 [Lolium rigidum]
MLLGKFDGILEFDFVRQSLAVIQVPVNMFDEGCCFTVVRAEGGGLGFLSVSKFAAKARLWKRKTDCDGVVSWGLGTTIELDKLLSLNSKKYYIRILGSLGFLNPSSIVAIIHSKVSILKKKTLVVDTMGLKFHTMHKMIVWLDMPLWCFG